jgi:hypothetical protein
MNLIRLFPDLRGGGAARVTRRLAQVLASPGNRTDVLRLRAEDDGLAKAQRHVPVRSLHASRPRRPRPDGLIAWMCPLTVLAPVAARIRPRKTRVAVAAHTRIYPVHRGPAPCAV